MHRLPAERSRDHAFAAILLAAAVAVTILAYWPGTGGAIHFDDQNNLGGLSEVDDTNSALEFAFSGRAGPVGRPVSLASFLPNAAAWPSDPAVFLRTNILIHTLNGVLVIWLLLLLNQARAQQTKNTALVPIFCGAIWMLMPILASSSLLIVQRMTTLSATFVLLGGIGYFYARAQIRHNGRIGLASMTLVLGVASVLAVAAKENGALLLPLILVAEVTLLARPTGVSRRVWRIWVGVVLVVPTALLLFYLASYIPYDDSVHRMRGFSAIERLLTQASILWEYLYLAFVPNVPALGPFHDDYLVATSILDSRTFLSVSGWLLALAAGIALRRKAPLFSFAVGWFLVGHSIESTTIPLELYFEHRNYLPLIGPVFAVVASAASAPPTWRRVLSGAAVAYLGVLAAVLYSVSSLWGDPRIAGEMWYIHRPMSVRAAEFLAKELETSGSPDVALKVFREIHANRPGETHLELQVLLVSCQIEPGRDHEPAAQSMGNKLVEAKFKYNYLPLLASAYDLGMTGRCPTLDSERVYSWIDALLSNPQFSLATIRGNLLLMQAQIAVTQGHSGLALEKIRASLELYPQPDRIELSADLLRRAGLQAAAESIVEQFADATPSHPLRAIAWQLGYERLRRPNQD